MTLYELLQYADKELDIIIQEVSRAKALERKMEVEAKKSYPKGISSLQEYAEIWRVNRDVPLVYSISYDYNKNKVDLCWWRVDFIPFNTSIMFADRESAAKFRDENLEELEWYFKEYKKL